MSWDQLLAIHAEAREAAAADAAAPPQACPNDGEPLRDSPRGRYCPFDGWRPGDPVADNAVG